MRFYNRRLGWNDLQIFKLTTLEAGLDGHRPTADLAVHYELRGFCAIQLAFKILLTMWASNGDEVFHGADSLGIRQNAN